MITILTDFGRRDPYVGIMEGIIARHCPGERVVHLTHQIPPGDVGAAAFWLSRSIPYFSAHTVHLAVVDPGVGTARRPLAVETRVGRFVVPDNGLLTDVLAQQKAESVRAVCLEPTRLQPAAPAAVGHTFHGRDLFSPAAALLARDGKLEALGRSVEVDFLERLSHSREGSSPGAGGVPDLDAARTATIRVVDHFGNLITDLEWPDGEAARVEVGGSILPWVHTYGAVQPGTLVALRGSFGTVEVAVANGSAHERTGLRAGQTVRVRPAAE